jgi:hypothetical protein
VVEATVRRRRRRRMMVMLLLLLLLLRRRRRRFRCYVDGGGEGSYLLHDPAGQKDEDARLRILHQAQLTLHLQCQTRENGVGMGTTATFTHRA